ncbi:MAG TPA: PEGA domain-containing protein [Terriglobales bacterium]|nr:PEGA domain-containing protein [Terriglobales bacterium]
MKLSFGKFTEIGVVAKQNSYVSEVTVENLTDKAVPRVAFNVYLTDKNNVRVGDGLLLVSDIQPKQSVKVQFQCTSLGVPSGLTVSAKREMLDPKARTVSLKVLSVPPGAKLKVDGADEGVTPKAVNLTVGTHNLEFSKEGYATGSTAVEIAPDELPGGSISFELGGLSRDTIELRDGTVLLGDAVSMSLTSVVVRVDGKEQTYPRNQIKKLILVEREVTQTPAITQPAPQ